MAKVAGGSGANRFPDACVGCPVGFMVGVRMMFGMIIGPVFGTSIPVVTKLVLRCTAAKPPESHIHHFSPARHNRFVGNPNRGGVISLDRDFWLWPSHSNEGLLIGNHFAKRAASSDSAAEAITNLMIWAIMRTALLNRGNGSFSEMKM